MLIDTSGLLCLHHKDEPLHTQAIALFTQAHQRLTHSYILAEFVPLCQARGLNRSAALAFAKELAHSDQIEVVWVDEWLHLTALELLERRLDKTYFLCDAVSFVLMRAYGITDALTTDRHFEQEGFVRLLKRVDV